MFYCPDLRGAVMAELLLCGSFINQRTRYVRITDAVWIGLRVVHFMKLSLVRVEDYFAILRQASAHRLQA